MAEEGHREAGKGKGKVQDNVQGGAGREGGAIGNEGGRRDERGNQGNLVGVVDTLHKSLRC
mgnify:CR=1 FL=1